MASTYRYDGQGRRMQQTEAGVSSYFVYGQAGQLLFSQDGVNRYNHIHLAGSLVAKRIVPFSGTTSIRYQHTDALGSPVAETSETGVLTRRERMTAYGEPADGTWQSGPGFTGHQMDASSKLVYMQQRYYDPVGGQFISTDPISSDPESGDNFNRYRYAANSPYGNVDPDGRLPWPSGIIRIAAESTTMLSDKEVVRVIELADSLPSARTSATEARIYMEPSGQASSPTTNGCTVSSCEYSLSELATDGVTIHLHQMVAGDDSISREYLGPRDFDVVDLGVVNVIKTPSGAVRTAERIMGVDFSRTIRGGDKKVDAHVERTMKPRMTNSEIAKAARTYRKR